MCAAWNEPIIGRSAGLHLGIVAVPGHHVPPGSGRASSLETGVDDQLDLAVLHEDGTLEALRDGDGERLFGEALRRALRGDPAESYLRELTEGLAPPPEGGGFARVD